MTKDTRHFRLLAISTCILLTLAAFGLPGRTFASPPMPGSYYLALGDSLGVGFETDTIPTDPTCQSPTAPGYVCIFYRYLKRINPQIQLNNLSISGADSCNLIHGYGNGSPCTRVPQHPDPQLAAAVQFLQAHPGQVSPITIEIGGNDLLPLLPAALQDPVGTAAKLPSVMKNYQANLDLALSTLRAAAPNAEIILATQYNPLGGIPSPPLPAGLATLAQTTVTSMNGIIKQEAQKNNVLIADVASAFDAIPGGAAALTYTPATLASGNPSAINIHPTAAGYNVYGQTVIEASGYHLPLTLAAHLAKKRVVRGKSQKVAGTTAASASVSIKVWLPQRKARTLSTTAAPDGTFTKSFKVGKVAGKGVVQVCVKDAAGQSMCGGKLTYSIR